VGSQDRLTRAAWVDAAYAVFEAEGLRAVRVETLARRLETTKGSFYWHFATRAELVGAVMDRWEVRDTEDVIALAERSSAPQERLAALFAAVAGRARCGERTLYLEAAAEGVTDTVARVTDRRVGFVADLLVRLDLPPEEARRRAVLALAIVVGLDQLSAGAGPQLVVDADEMLRSTLAIVAAPTGSA
jgi:AcrR family transcriptional regulator